MRVGLVMKYLVKKLRLESETEVFINKHTQNTPYSSPFFFNTHIV